MSSGMLMCFAVALFALTGCNVTTGSDDSVRVDCGTPGPGGIDCDLARTSGDNAVKVCWDLEITCENGGVMSGSACGKMDAVDKTKQVNMPVADFSNQDKCDAPKSGMVKNLKVERQ